MIPNYHLSEDSTFRLVGRIIRQRTVRAFPADGTLSPLRHLQVVEVVPVKLRTNPHRVSMPPCRGCAPQVMVGGDQVEVRAPVPEDGESPRGDAVLQETLKGTGCVFGPLPAVARSLLGLGCRVDWLFSAVAGRPCCRMDWMD